MSMLHGGGCRCGRVRFAARAGPVFASYCHCSDCRHATGAPVAAYVGFEQSAVDWSGQAPASYGAAPVSRLFCADCGAPIGYRDARIASRIYFLIGAMDEPEAYPPQQHGYAGEQLSWLMLADDLPRYAQTTEPRPGMHAPERMTP